MKSLYQAISKVYPKINNPRSSDWFIYKSKRKFLLNIIISELIDSNANNLYKEEEILKAWDNYGKNKKLAETST